MCVDPLMTDWTPLTTSVLMRRERVPGAMSKWQTWRWVLHDVTGHDVLPHAEHFGTAPRSAAGHAGATRSADGKSRQ